jgi:hypothetical protein
MLWGGGGIRPDKTLYKLLSGLGFVFIGRHWKHKTRKMMRNEAKSSEFVGTFCFASFHGIAKTKISESNILRKT